MVFSLLILVFSVGAMEFESGFWGHCRWRIIGDIRVTTGSLKISLEDKLTNNIDLYLFCVISWVYICVDWMNTSSSGL